MSDEKSPVEPPVACTLTAAQLAEKRTTLIPGLLQRAVEVSELPNGIRLRFETQPGLIEDLAKVMEQERECCRFLRFELRADPAGGPIVLEITGPEGTGEMLRGL